jgi:hypothetical protein
MLAGCETGGFFLVGREEGEERKGKRGRGREEGEE